MPTPFIGLTYYYRGFEIYLKSAMSATIVKDSLDECSDANGKTFNGSHRAEHYVDWLIKSRELQNRPPKR
jgi:hypothetical protein